LDVRSSWEVNIKMDLSEKVYVDVFHFVALRGKLWRAAHRNETSGVVKNGDLGYLSSSV
jgi:hypothetical protein